MNFGFQPNHTLKNEFLSSNSGNRDNFVDPMSLGILGKLIVK